jgi:transposase
MELPEGYILIKQSDYQALLDTIFNLTQRVKELEGQLHKDSHNSHIPPSKSIHKVIKNSREQTGRKQGGQKGHKGTTLSMVCDPDQIEIYPVTTCRCCGKNLQKIEVDSYEKRQVFDLPEIKMKITEHQVEIKTCACGFVNKAEFPKTINGSVQYGVNVQALCVNLSNYQFLSYDRISEFMEDLTGYRINESTITRQNKILYNQLESFETQIKTLIQKSPISHHDESGIYCEGERIWLHSSSTKNMTHYGVDAVRGKDATDRIGILPNKTGKIMHDNWATYFQYINCEHALCNAHHLRELTWFEEEENAIWANQIKRLLLDSKKQVEQAQEQGRLSTKQIKNIETQYQTIVQSAIEGITIPVTTTKKRGKIKKPKQLNFLERFVKHKKSVLAYIYDFNIPFDNNLAERDIRMIKVKQKINGTFRSLEGAKHFVRIRSYISTVKKNNRNVFEEIRNAMLGTPYFYNAS